MRNIKQYLMFLLQLNNAIHKALLSDVYDSVDRIHSKQTWF